MPQLRREGLVVAAGGQAVTYGERFVFFPFYGAFRFMPEGAVVWEHNPKLCMSRDEQFRRNKEAGHFEGKVVMNSPVFK